MVSYLCRISENTIDDDRESSILCDFCNSGIHPKCNHLNFLDFKHISGNNSDSWLCFRCISETFPLGNLNNQHLHLFIHNNSEMNESSVGKRTNVNSILTLNPPPNFKLLFNQFNELIADSNKKNPENIINCGNLDIDEIQKMRFEPNSLSSFHTNSRSLNKSFEDLECLLKATTANKTFDVIAISESRMLKDTNLSKNINIYITTPLNLLQLNLMQVEPYFTLVIKYLLSLDKIFIFINRVKQTDKEKKHQIS